MSRLPAYQPATRADEATIERRAQAVRKLLALEPLTKQQIVEISGKWDMDTTLHAMDRLLEQGAITWCNTSGPTGHQVFKVRHGVAA
jgi:hypothetical protein